MVLGFASAISGPVRKDRQGHIYAPNPDSYQGRAHQPSNGVRMADNRPVYGWGGNPAPTTYGWGGNPAPPTYDQHMAPSAPVGAQQPEGAPASKMEPELRRSRWATFLLGNTLSAAVLIYEMSQLEVCFDGFDLEFDDDASSTTIHDQIQYEATLTRDMVMFTLVLSLLVEVIAAIVLSVTYKSPLDIKSVHKIPHDDLRNKCATTIIFFLAPFSWALIYLFGGISSIFYSLNSSCEGQGGSGLVLYLRVSGVLMVFAGVVFLGVSALSVWLPCGPCTKVLEGRCQAASEMMSTRILTKGLFIDMFWMAQGVVWSYRTGAFAEDVSLIVGMCSFLGEGLAAFGSVALECADCCSGFL